MAGQILGVYFKSILGSMLASTTAELFPGHSRRIAEMRDEQWYEWDEYVRVMQDLRARLSDSSLRTVAQASMVKTLPLIKTAGFDTVERVFNNFDALSKDVVRGMPPEESIRTVSFTKDAVVLESNTRLPVPLLSGFFQGILIAFSHVLISEEVTKHGPTTRFTLKWS